jgi:nitrogen regulatory protein PII
MHFKLIITLVKEDITDVILDTARKAGATGATVLNQVRGEGIEASKTFFGLNLEAQRDMLMFLVEEHMSRSIMESIADIGKFDKHPGSGIVFQVDVEDALGVTGQINKLSDLVEERI